MMYSCLMNNLRDSGCCDLSAFRHDDNINNIMSQDDDNVNNNMRGSTTWICANDVGNVLSLNISNDHEGNHDRLKNTVACECAITAIAISPSGSQIAIAFNDSLHLRTFPDVDNDFVLDDVDNTPMQMLCRRTLPITHVEYDSHGKIFVSSQEPDILIQPTDSSSVEYKISTNNIGIVTFAISKDSKYLCYVDVNGLVRIFSLEYKDTMIEGERYVKAESETFVVGVVSPKVTRCVEESFGCRVAWSPNVDVPAVIIPFREGAALMLTRQSDDGKWTEKNFVTSTHKSEYLTHGGVELNLVNFSPCGNFIATADMNGDVLIWDLKTDAPISKVTCSLRGPLSNISFDLNGDNYLLVTAKSYWGKVDNILSISTPAEAEFMEVDADKGKTKPEKRVAFDDNNDNDNNSGADYNTQSVYKKHKRLQKNSGCNDDVDEYVDDEEKDDDDVEYDDNDNGGFDAAATTEEIMNLLESARSVSQQKSFQPACTDFDDKSRRYLCWNSVGTVTLQDSNDRIEIRFRNRSGKNRNEVFTNNLRYTKAALAYAGAVFTSDPEELDPEQMQILQEVGHLKLGAGSTIFYKPFSGFLNGINEQFYQKLDDGEGVDCVAVGTYWIAVATTKGYLRVYSSTGQDVIVLTLKGPVVTLTGFSNKLAVFYHRSTPVNKTMSISCDLFDIQLGKLPQLLVSTVVPMSSEGSLKWCGFDVELGYLAILDSKEKLNILNQACGWQWVPVLDIEKVKVPGHEYWPVYVRDGKLFFILLNGESRPAIYPEPLTSLKPFKICIAEPKDEKNKQTVAVRELQRNMLWEVLKITDIENRSANENIEPDVLESKRCNADKAVLKLFGDVCKSSAEGTNARAMDLASRLKSNIGLMTAQRVANMVGKPNVARYVSEIIESREAQEEDEEEEEQYEDRSGNSNMDNNENVNDDEFHRDYVSEETTTAKSYSSSQATPLSESVQNKSNLGNMKPARSMNLFKKTASAVEGGSISVISFA